MVIVIMVADGGMCGIIVVQIVVNVIRTIVAIISTIVRVVIVGTYARVVIITRSGPVMSVRPVDVAPVIAKGQRVNAHVIVSIETYAGHIVGGIADENITTVVNDIEIFRLGRICVCMWSLNGAPVNITINIFDGMRSIIGNSCNGNRRTGCVCRCVATAERKKCNKESSKDRISF